MKIGIMASQISGHLYTPTGSMYHIASTTLSTASSTVTFSSIPATYTHLQIRAMAKVTGTSTPSVAIKFNSDAGANYRNHYLYGDGSSVVAGTAASGNAAVIASDFEGANVFGIVVLDILDYANTNKYKVTRSLSGKDNNGDGWVILRSVLWTNSSAISQIDLTDAGGQNFKTYSSFALYGVK